MSAGAKIPLAQARRIAHAAICLLGDLPSADGSEHQLACSRIYEAGSVRRRRPEVGDIELVAIPVRSEQLTVDSGQQGGGGLF